MVELTPELEKRLLMIVPLVVKWIEKDKKLKETEIQTFYKLYADIYDWAKDATYEDLMKFNKKYENDKHYEEYFKILLSPKGREYSKYLLQLANEWKPKFVKFSQINE